MNEITHKGVRILQSRYAFDVSIDEMGCIEERDAEQFAAGRLPLQELLPDVSDATGVDYFYNGTSIYFNLRYNHSADELQNVIDHITMYMEWVDCRWITEP